MNTITFKNGDVRLSCNVFGVGQPLIFLHGNAGSNKYFTPIAKQLAQDGYQVYALDSRSHGQSDKVKHMNYKDMAEDVIQLIKTQKLEKPIVYGYSDGGIIGLYIAIKQPNILQKLIVSGVNITPEGINSITRLRYKFIYLITRSSKFKMVLEQPHISLKELETITVPTIVLRGENDFVSKSQNQEIVDHISNATLVTISKENHSSYVRDKDKLYALLKEYL